MQEYYNLLGLSTAASQEDIKKAYRKLAMEHHPDRGGDEEQFKKVTEAYEILTGKRQQKSEQNQHHAGFSDFDIFQDIFARMGVNPENFGFKRKTEQRPPSEDKNIVFSLEVSVEAIKSGKSFNNVQFKKSIKCEKCQGNGAKNKYTCVKCRGSGLISAFQKQGGNIFMSSSPCTECSGRGTVMEEPCADCNANGYSTITETISFEVKEIK